MDEPVPVGRAAIGCVVLALAVIAIGLLVRPAIFSLAPPRDDSAVTVASATEVTSGPIRRDVILSRSRGWSGELDAGDGRVQLSVIVATTPAGGIGAVNAASPGRTTARSRSAPIAWSTVTARPGHSTASRSTQPIRRWSASACRSSRARSSST